MKRRIVGVLLSLICIATCVVPVHAESRSVNVTADATSLPGSFSKKVEVKDNRIPTFVWNDTLTKIVNNIMTNEDKGKVEEGKFVTAKLTIQSEDYDTLKATYDLTEVEKAFTNLVSMDITLDKVLSNDRAGADVISTESVPSVTSDIEVAFVSPAIPSGKYIKSFRLLHLAGGSAEEIACSYTGERFVAKLKEFSPYVFYYELADKPKETEKKDTDSSESSSTDDDDDDDGYVYPKTPVPTPEPVPVQGYNRPRKATPNVEPVKADPVKGKPGRRFTDDPDHHVVVEEDPVPGEIVVDNPVEKPIDKKDTKIGIYVGIGIGFLLLLIVIALIIKYLHDKYEEYNE